MTEYQYEIAGVLFGDGTALRVEDITGLGKAGERAGDVEIPAGHGAFPVVDYLEPRTVSFQMQAVGATAAQAMGSMRQLGQAWSPSDVTTPGTTTPLRVHLPGFGPYFLIGRPRRFEAVITDVVVGVIGIVADYVAHDPLFYSDEQTVTLSLGGTVTSTGQGQTSYGKGVQAPLVAPLVLNAAPGAPAGAVDRPGAVRVVGNAPIWPEYEFLGPVLGPRLQIGPYVLSFPELNLGVDQVLRIVTHPVRRSVTVNGASRYTLLARGTRLRNLTPGLYDLRFTARTYDSRARATVRWRSGFTV